MKLGALLLLAPVLAVYRDDVGVHDWKRSALGVPAKAAECDGGLAVISEGGSLGLVSKNGVSAWRHDLSDAQISSGLACVNGVIVVGGDSLMAFESENGHLLWRHGGSFGRVRRQGKYFLLNDDYLVDVAGNDVADPVNEAEVVDLVYEGDGSANTIELPQATVSWDEFHVLTWTDSVGDLIWTLDEGLAKVTTATFVQIPGDEDEDEDLEARLKWQQVNAEGRTAIQAAVDRVLAHLKQLYQLVWFILKRGPAMLVLPERDKPQFGFNQILVVTTELGSVYGLNVSNYGVVEWVYHDLEAASVWPGETASQCVILSSTFQKYQMTGAGDILSVNTVHDEFFNATMPSLLMGEARVDSSMGWSLDVPGELVALEGNDDRPSGSIVVSTSDGNVLYKYLNPHITVAASYQADEKLLTMTLLDVITGRILAQHAHPEPVLVNDEWPLSLVVGEHWYVYTYFTPDESQTMKVTMVELYESGVPNERMSGEIVDLWNDTAVPYVVSHTWVLPSKQQPVYSLAVSKSPYGAAAREIVMAMESRIISFAKADLDALAPAAELAVPANGHLSHIYGVSPPSHLAIGVTNSEFTYLLTNPGSRDIFMTRVSPAGEVDRLSSEFPKVKLIIFVSTITFSVITLSPLARNKKLHELWR